MINIFKYTLIGLFVFTNIQCNAKSLPNDSEISDLNVLTKEPVSGGSIVLGAENTVAYLHLLKGKKVGVLSNQTGILKENGKEIHLVDFLLKKQIQLVKIFSPEHGFRGEEDAGELVKSGIDQKTGLPIISLYGKNRKPKAEQISDLDVILFDLQDVGARFYTYISTLHYVMEAAAENNVKVIVLDRPNPNAHYIDGPILNPKYKTFVGMHPVPIVYGMTIGEYGKMINGEGWLNNKIQADLEVIPLLNYTHQSKYSLPVKPSPNLPNDTAINLYPSTCFFEGINGSEGRGTDKPFQVYGSPYLKNMPYTFTPKPTEGAKSPRFNGEKCYGEDLSNTPRLSEIRLDWLIKAYKNNTKSPFWIKNSGKLWIDILAGTEQLRLQIEKGMSEEEIKATWQKDLDKFKVTRAKYLIYED